MANGPPSPASDSAVAAAPGPGATGVAGGAVAARVRSGSVSSAVTGRPASGTTPPRDAPADGVRGEQHRPRAGGLHDVERRVVEHAVGGPGDVGGHGGLQQRRQDLPPWAERARGRVDEPAAAEGDEVGVGVGQRDHAPALRHGRKLGEPLPGHRGTGARDRRPAPPDDLVALAHHGGGLDEVGVDRQAEPRAHRRPDGRALRERGDHARRAVRWWRRRRRGSRCRAAAATPARWRCGAAARRSGRAR